MKYFLRGIIAAAAIFLCCGCSDLSEMSRADDGRGFGRQSGEGVFQYTDTAMGTVIQQTVYAPEEAAERFFDKSMELLRELESEELSWRLETSEVYRINLFAGREEGCPVSPEMGALLEACVDLNQASEGAFDVTLGPLTRLWDVDSWAADGEKGEFQPPSAEAVEKALRLCGSDRLRILREDSAEGSPEEAGESGSAHVISEGKKQPEASVISEGKKQPEASVVSEGEKQPGARVFLEEGMKLDLGAVGKGLAQSRLYDLLQEETEITGAVISLGGSVLTYGRKADGSAWKVGIVNPFDTASQIGILSLEGQWCVSTSGDYERYVETDGVRYHHILDPATGAPAVSDVRGVTILTKNGLSGDALSTACFILGPERGMALAAEYGVEVLFVMADGEIVMSEGMERYFS